MTLCRTTTTVLHNKTTLVLQVKQPVTLATAWQVRGFIKNQETDIVMRLGPIPTQNRDCIQWDLSLGYNRFKCYM